MHNPICTFIVAILLVSRFALSQVPIPAPNGTYAVALATLELENTHSIQPFAPREEIPDLMLSVFYPTDEKELVHVPYMDPDTARFEGLAMAQQSGLGSDAATFQKLSLQLAANGSTIAQPDSQGGWPLLIFGCGFGTNRFLYGAILSEIASTGYVVVAYDTPYDTDIIVYPGGENITANQTVTAALDTGDAAVKDQILTADTNAHAQDASFIISSFSNSSFAASTIPGCKSCLNTTHVGYFGHSAGGATGTTLMLNDTRVAGGINFDGAVTAADAEQGIDRPYMLMAVTGQTREGKLAKDILNANWAALWANLRGPSFDLILTTLSTILVGTKTAYFSFRPAVANCKIDTDLPLILQLLDIFPTNQTTLNNLQITAMNGGRAHHIVSTYAVTFFDWLLKGAPNDLLKCPSPEFPEVSVDTGSTQVFSNGTTISATNGSVIYQEGGGS